MMSAIAANWRGGARARVDAACVRAGRAPGDVTLIAVSKRQPASAVREAIAAGARDLGENYAQELAAKAAENGEVGELRWHFIGRLQRNKVKLVAGKVALLHAVDSVELAIELGKRAARRGRRPRKAILLAANVADEASKGGAAVAEVSALARALAAVDGIRLDGMMTMPPPADDPEAARPHFAALRALRDRVAAELGAALPVLSMGMSADFEVAIAEGATHVRVGTAIFGERPTNTA